MALERIIEKIKKDAEKKKEEILKEAQEEKEKILKEARTKAEEILKKAEEEKEKLKEAKKRSILGSKRIELNVKLLVEKRKIIDEVYKEAFEELRKSELYLRLMEHLLETLVETGEEEVILPRNDDKITPDFIEKLNKKKNWSLKISQERADIDGGFMLRAEKREIDASIPKIIEIIKEETEVEVSKILFP